MLTNDQELFIEIIDQIEDKETKAKYIRKIIEQQNTKPKPKTKFSNSYKMKDIFQYYKKTRTYNSARFARRNKTYKSSNRGNKIFYSKYRFMNLKLRTSKISYNK